MRPAAVKRGEVWIADVPDDKRRPVLVLTRDPMGAILNAVVVAPITRTVRGLATEVPVGKEAGLSRASVANFDNTSQVRRHSFVRRLGEVDETTMEEACRALATAVGCG
jgi:mRNA interferase MazF